MTSRRAAEEGAASASAAGDVTGDTGGNADRGPGWLGKAVLLLIVAQNSAHVLTTRYSRLPGQPPYNAGAMVLCYELTKLVFCVLMVLATQPAPSQHIWQKVVTEWDITLKVALPAVLYVVQVSQRDRTATLPPCHPHRDRTATLPPCHPRPDLHFARVPIVPTAYTARSRTARTCHAALPLGSDVLNAAGAEPDGGRGRGRL